MTTLAGTIGAAKPRDHQWAGILLLFVVLILPPLMAPDAYWIGTMIFALCMAMPVIGLSLLSGMTGQLAISHGAFYALGAYGSALLNVRLGITPLLATGATLVLSGLVALVIGWLVLRLRSHYLAIATLAFAVIVEVILEEWTSVTGGLQGLGGIESYGLLGLSLRGDAATAICYSVALVIVFTLALNLARSRIGRILRAIREQETVVFTFGLDAGRYKLAIYVISSVLAALGGAMYAHYISYITPNVGAIMFAFDVIMVLAIGGFGSLWGALVGVVLITLLNEFALNFAQYKRVVLGASLVLVVLYFPEGLLPGLARLFRLGKGGNR